MSLAAELHRFLAEHPRLVRVEVREAQGSTPRERGAWMLVASHATLGTIGGGQLEWMAIARAREMLAPAAESGDPPSRDASEDGVTMNVPLGPEIGQCCGGRVLMALRQMDEETRAEVLADAEAQDAARPCVLLFGAGHVGHALAAALALLPIRTTVVETRADALGDLPAGVETRLTPVPEQAVRAAPPGSAFAILTHDHALDFLLASEALRRGDAAYVGMIGSGTKRATFRSWFRDHGGTEDQFARLVCPIGGTEVRDKRPAVIAALAAAEIVTALANGHGA